MALFVFILFGRKVERELFWVVGNILGLTSFRPVII